MESVHSFGPDAGPLASDPAALARAGSTGRADDSPGGRASREEGRSWGRTASVLPSSAGASTRSSSFSSSPTPRRPKRLADDMAADEPSTADIRLPERKSRSAGGSPASLRPVSVALWDEPPPSPPGPFAVLDFDDDDAPAPPAPQPLTEAQVGQLVDLADTGDPAQGLQDLWRALRLQVFSRWHAQWIDDQGRRHHLGLLDHRQVAHALVARWGGKAITPERLDLIGDLLIHESGLSLRSNFLDMELAQFLLTLLTQAPADAQARGVVTRRWLVRAFGPAPSGHPAWPYTGRGFALALLRSLNISGVTAERLAWALNRVLLPSGAWAADDARHQWSAGDLQTWSAMIRRCVSTQAVPIDPVLLKWMCHSMLGQGSFSLLETAACMGGLTAEIQMEQEKREDLAEEAGQATAAWAMAPANCLGLLRVVLGMADGRPAYLAAAAIGLAAGRQHGILPGDSPVSAAPPLPRMLARLPGGLDALAAWTAELLAQDDLPLCQVFLWGLTFWLAREIGDAPREADMAAQADVEALRQGLHKAVSVVGSRWTGKALIDFGSCYARVVMRRRLTGAQRKALLDVMLPIRSNRPPDAARHWTSLRTALDTGLGMVDREHHPRPDGKGRPQGLEGADSKAVEK